jgi:predicted metal-dependent HD superfamily phosphohydrolase
MTMSPSKRHDEMEARAQAFRKAMDQACADADAHEQWTHASVEYCDRVFKRWMAAWHYAHGLVTGRRGSDETGKMLLDMHTQPSRFYHNQNHVLQAMDAARYIMKEEKSTLRTLIAKRSSREEKHGIPLKVRERATHLLAIHDHMPHALGMTMMALMFHDAVYDPRASRGVNESMSADLASIILGCQGWASHHVDMVAKAIRATADHRCNARGTQVDAHPAKVIEHLVISATCDADLSILASDPEQFKDYRMRIRQEYAYLSDNLFDIGTRHFAKRMYYQRPIFSTSPALQKWESRALRNLEGILGDDAVPSWGS